MFTEVIQGTQYAWGNRVVEVDGPQSSSTLAARDVATGECLTVAICELTPVKKPPVGSGEIGKILQPQWDKAKAEAQLLLPLIGGGRVDGVVMASVCKELGKSPRQVQRTLKRLRASPLVSTAVGRKAGRRTGSRMLDKDVEHVVSHCLQKHYLVSERPSGTFVIERIERLCRKLKLPCPSLETIRRRIYTLDGFESMAARRGKRAARQNYVPLTGSLVTTRPLEVVQIDHTRVDLMVVSDDLSRVTLGRPWLTLALDVHTRCVLGLYLSMDAPSAISVALCIAHAILPKEQWLKSYGFDAPWPMYGRPIKIHTDNGTDFRGTAIARGCDELGVILEHRPVGLPEWGGHIERLIGTFMGRVHCLPGTTFSNPKAKGDEYDSEGKACMTLGELREWLVHEICFRYHVTIHRGIRTTPAKAWEEGFSAKSTNEREDS